MKQLILSLAVGAFAATTGLVQAQDEKPKRPATGGGGGAGAAARMNPDDRLKMLTASLGLTQEQQDKVKKIIDESRPEFDKIRGLSQEERRPKYRELMQKQNDKIAEALTPEQKEKFKTAMAQRGTRAAGGGAAGAGGDTNAPKKEGDKPAGEKK